MAVEIVMPRVDMDMSSGRMGRWHAAEGAHVVKGATLFEIETDKAAMEIDAPASGVLKFVAASEGDVLPVGACIGWIVADGETFAPPPNGAAPTSLAPPPATGRSEESQPSDPKAIGKIWPDPPPSLPHDSPSKDGRPSGRPMGGGEELGARPRATPAARRVARERGLRLESVRGSGPLGRIQRRDLETPARAAPASTWSKVPSN